MKHNGFKVGDKVCNRHLRNEFVIEGFDYRILDVEGTDGEAIEIAYGQGEYSDLDELVKA